MGCTASSVEGNDTAFEVREAEIRANMRENVLRANPLTAEQALTRLSFEVTGTLKSYAEIVDRTPQDAFADGSEVLLDAVHYAIVKLNESETDTVTLKRMIKGILSRGADPNLLGREQGRNPQLGAIHILAKHCGPDGNQAHCRAVLEELLQDPRTDVNLADPATGDSPAHIIGRLGRDLLLALLFKKPGYKHNSTNASGETISDAINVGTKLKHKQNVLQAQATLVGACKGDTAVNIEKAVGILKRAENIDGIDYMNGSIEELDGMTYLGKAAQTAASLQTFQVLISQGGCDTAKKDLRNKIASDYLENRHPDSHTRAIQQMLMKK